MIARLLSWLFADALERARFVSQERLDKYMDAVAADDALPVPTFHS